MEPLKIPNFFYKMTLWHFNVMLGMLFLFAVKFIDRSFFIYL
ncbi:hypothetical protein ROSMUCSMR3_02916 [Roseovarius mucosus]|uniref:Uncharacterized protein n=1 Tax=Roseovarius mucosus TaxID=215743 RepID=A0A1V0RRJ0_9RHOB|nr:hypothetical protein ROSMUCSMR3_02916 [Roseovarius mucosus]